MTKITFSVEWKVQIEAELEKRFKTKVIIPDAVWPVKIHSCYCFPNNTEFSTMTLCLGGPFLGPCILLRIRFDL